VSLIPEKRSIESIARTTIGIDTAIQEEPKCELSNRTQFLSHDEAPEMNRETRSAFLCFSAKGAYSVSLSRRYTRFD
jgi:hypothetical protein